MSYCCEGNQLNGWFDDLLNSAESIAKDITGSRNPPVGYGVPGQTPPMFPPTGPVYGMTAPAGAVPSSGISNTTLLLLGGLALVFLMSRGRT